jgi:hypothetical protein
MSMLPDRSPRASSAPHGDDVALMYTQAPVREVRKGTEEAAERAALVARRRPDGTAGAAARQRGAPVTCRCPVPSAFMTQTCMAPVRLL